MIGDNLLVSESGIIAADLSECVKSDEIADWAKAESKPLYTAEEVGAAAKTHTHTADEIGAAAKMSIILRRLGIRIQRLKSARRLRRISLLL